MDNFNVYDQRIPTFNPRVKEHEANLPFCGQLRAKNEAEAIQEAKARRWSRWPLVVRMDRDDK